MPPFGFATPPALDNPVPSGCGTLRSALLVLEGARAGELARRWEGTVQWICASPYRPNHARKSRFIGVASFAPPPAGLEGEVRFETLRASGPGGQHIDTTDSAVRATHLATGAASRCSRSAAGT